MTVSPNKKAIIIFTKDRPETLFKTLNTLKNLDIQIIVLDDSSIINNSRLIKEKIKSTKNIVYHGRNEQNIVIAGINDEEKNVKKFVNRLGSKKWNLGFARNYAILLAKNLDIDRLLFMDDDIIVENDSLIQEMFEKLDSYDFVGSKVTGMIDDSMIGYIVRELNYPSEEYFSGGFVAFKTSVITDYFINDYNEDWIWMYFHQSSCKFCLHGHVKQLPYNNFENAIQKGKNQEFGELLVDGVKEAFEAKDFRLLTKKSFWKRLLTEKQEYYHELKELSVEKKRLDLYKILFAVSNYSTKFNENVFISLFENYYKEKKEWGKILNAKKMNSEEKISYQSGDSIMLSAVYNLPAKPKYFALMAHGITTDKNEWNNLHFRISQDLNAHKIGTFRFDYRGHGESQGTMRDMTIAGEFIDVKSSMDQISKKWKKKVSIVASSFGAGSAILYTALNPEKVNSLILLNPVIDYDATFLNPIVDWAKDTFNKKGYKHLAEKGYILLDGEHALDAKLVAEFQMIKPYEFLKNIKCPVLTIHGDKDSMVPYKISKKYGKPNKNSMFITIKNAEHGFIDWNDEEGTTELSMKNQKEVTKMIINWVEKWGAK